MNEVRPAKPPCKCPYCVREAKRAERELVERIGGDIGPSWPPPWWIQVPYSMLAGALLVATLVHCGVLRP